MSLVWDRGLTMWYSSLTPFASTYRPEAASGSEDALKRTPASDAGDASVSDGGSSQTVADAGSVAASVRDLSKPIDVGQMSPEQAKGRYDQLKAVLRFRSDLPVAGLESEIRETAATRRNRSQ